MEHRQLGRSGLRVSTITLGTMGFAATGGFDSIGDIDVDGARRQLDMCIDAGVNLVDTANMYSAGASEETLGQAIEGRRDRLMVATKVRFAMGEGANDAGLSRWHIIESVEASLRRLRTDHIDLLQVHEWDGQTPLEETLSALDDLVRAGKVRYVGASNYTAWQLVKAMGIAERRGLEPFVSQQIHYTPQAREAEFELLPAGLDQGLGTLVWSPIAGGLLSGKYRRDQEGPEGSRHLGDWDEPPVHDTEALYDLVEVLVEVGEAHGVSAAQVTLAWLLTRPAVTSLIIGARTEEQLADNLAAAELSLTAEEVERIDVASRPHLPYPLWHQADSASDRLGPADRAFLAPHLDEDSAALLQLRALGQPVVAAHLRLAGAALLVVGLGLDRRHLGRAAVVVQGHHRDVGGGGVLDGARAQALLLHPHAHLHRAAPGGVHGGAHGDQLADQYRPLEGHPVEAHGDHALGAVADGGDAGDLVAQLQDHPAVGVACGVGLGEPDPEGQLRTRMRGAAGVQGH